jgi:YVTN family beta-propeller protein
MMIAHPVLHCVHLQDHFATRLLVLVRLFTFLFASLAFHFTATTTRVAAESQAGGRGPVAIVSDGDKLFVANRKSGTASVLDAEALRVLDEFKLGKSLSDLIAVPNSDLLLATDELRHELIVIQRHGARLSVKQRVRVPHTPVGICVTANGRKGSVASPWSRRLAFFEIESGTVKVAETINLPFAPRLQVFDASGQWLYVADSFTGRLGVVDVERQKLRAIRAFDGHNIRGLTVSPNGEDLMIAHQRLSTFTATTRSRIFWGTLMGNAIISVALDDLQPAAKANEQPLKEKQIAHWSLYPLGEPNKGAGDPGEILVAPSGQTVVCLSGVDEVGFVRPVPNPMQRVRVGRLPTAVASDDEGRTLYVANALDDSISVIDVATARVETTISLGTQPPLTTAQQGERLFFDARLSLHGWFSCHSCHTDGHTNGQLNDNLGDDGFGAPKRVLSLLGAAETAPWAWQGSQASLASQIHKSIESTMQGKETGRLTKENVAALQAFVRTMPPPPSLAAARGEFNHAAIRRGSVLFEKHNCLQCHRPPIYSSKSVFDVGIHDEVGQKKFNPPSLLGVSQRGPYFHDGRAKALRNVFDEFNHPSGLQMDAGEVDDVVEFLKSL